jgi:hypothetical protein
MKAMVWIKVGGGVLVVLAALAAADTRYVDVAKETSQETKERAIASRTEGCMVLHGREALKSGCCKKEAKEEPKSHSGCCRK